LSAPSSGGPIGVLRLFVDIARFRKGPEDLPVSRALLLACIVSGITLHGLLWKVIPLPFQGSPLMILLVSAGATVLMLARRPERFLQTASAVFGFQLVVLPVQAAVGWFAVSVGSSRSWQLMLSAAGIVLALWELMVVARILRSATERSMAACVGMAILGDLLVFMVVAGFFTLNLPQATQA
jgi:hypothetical protein